MTDYPVKSCYQWTDEEVIRALLQNRNDWMTPEETRRAHGLPKGCAQSHRLRPKFVELIKRRLVEGEKDCPGYPKGWRYKLTRKGISYAKRMGWLKS